MPIETQVDAEKRLTVVRYVHPWSLDDFFRTFTENVTLHRLADLTAAGPLDWVNIDVLRQIAAYAQKYDGHRQPGGRTAFVVPEAYSRPLIRLFQALTEGEQERSINIRVFSNWDDAMAWLLSETDT
jgi:hypothetical protein